MGRATRTGQRRCTRETQQAEKLHSMARPSCEPGVVTRAVIRPKRRAVRPTEPEASSGKTNRLCRARFPQRHWWGVPWPRIRSSIEEIGGGSWRTSLGAGTRTKTVRAPPRASRRRGDLLDQRRSDSDSTLYRCLLLETHPAICPVLVSRAPRNPVASASAATVGAHLGGSPRASETFSRLLDMFDQINAEKGAVS